MAYSFASLYRGTLPGPRWKPRSTPTSAIANIIYGDKFVAMSFAGYALTSSDGITWTQRTTPSNQGWRGLAYGNGTYVACYGNTGSGVGTSPDGITWTPRNMTYAALLTPAYGNVGGTTPTFVLTGISTNIANYSTDNGANWYASTLPYSTSWLATAFGAGMFVALPSSADTRYAYSSNGISWTQGTLPFPASWTSLIYAGGRFVATSDTGYCLTSTDGLSWTMGWVGVNSQWGYQSLTWDGTRYAVVGYSTQNGYSRIAFSTDGLKWFTRPTMTSYSPSSVAYGNGIYGLVSSSSTPYIWTGAPNDIIDSAVLYTVPAGKTAVVTSYSMANTTVNTSSYAELQMGGVEFRNSMNISPNEFREEAIKQVLNAGDKIIGYSIESKDVIIHINGVVS